MSEFSKEHPVAVAILPVGTLPALRPLPRKSTLHQPNKVAATPLDGACSFAAQGIVEVQRIPDLDTAGAVVVTFAEQQ
jgi:hypothetical protein